jgi:hypothetical protein
VPIVPLVPAPGWQAFGPSANGRYTAANAQTIPCPGANWDARIHAPGTDEPVASYVVYMTFPTDVNGNTLNDIGRTFVTAFPHFACYETERPVTPLLPVNLVDQFGSADVFKREPLDLCNPTDKNSETPGAEASAAHLVGYKLFSETRFTRVSNVEVVNQFGTVVVDLTRRSRLLVPSTKSLSSTPAPLPAGALDHFACYFTKRARFAARFTPIAAVDLVDQFGPIAVKVLKPRVLCTPVNKNGESPGAETHAMHLLCYDIKGRVPLNMSRTPIFVNNQFGPQTLKVEHRRLLCLPSLKNLL